MYHSRMRLVLASASPRRIALLRGAGYEFDTVAADVDESARPGEAAADYVRRVSLLKARAVAASAGEAVVLAADTTVVLGGEMLGKPADGRDARRMLERLSGRTHDVLTGVAVVCGADAELAVESTAVSFRELSASEVDWYVATGEPADKAGAYAVQGLGSRFVARVTGSYSNVVGLPLETVQRLLEAAGVVRAWRPEAAAGGGREAEGALD
ncbi:MAG TPA: Maf family protein [Vicinamibacterales bacterium]|nr:Maf family protein [Vicinamibacterales bacterium]